MIPKEFDQIEKADIDALVANETPEGRSLDYKRELPGASDSDKKEFLADVSSLANTVGGDLIYGVEERIGDQGNTGIPAKVSGIADCNADAEIRRLEGIVREGLSPRVNGLRIRAITGFASGPVLLIRVPRSWSAPHMVCFKQTSRFYSRTTGGKYQLDVHELRLAFEASGGTRERLQRLRDDRIGKILSGETPIQMPRGPRIMLFLIPFAATEVSNLLDPPSLMPGGDSIAVLNAQMNVKRINFDGVLSYAAGGDKGPSSSYTQVFRSGVIESVDCGLLAAYADRKSIPARLFEQGIIEVLEAHAQLLRKLQIAAPFWVSIALQGVKDFDLMVDQRLTTYHRLGPIDRDMLLMPDVLIESQPDRPTDDLTPAFDVLLKPVFDALWQAVGYLRSGNYSAAGRWEPRA